jgi:hypothetical protein
MGMIFRLTPLDRALEFQVILLMQCYSPVHQREETFAHFSPNILECIFREGTEYQYHHSHFGNGSAIRPVDSEMYQMEYWAASALADACLQVCSLIASYCNKTAYLDTYGPFSLIYTRFFEAGIKYPPEPHDIFHYSEYLVVHNSLEGLLDHIHRAQLWALWMITALHCLALYDGLTVAETCRQLPNLPVAQLELAKIALKEKEHGDHTYLWNSHHGALNHGQVSSPECSPSPFFLAPPVSPMSPLPAPPSLPSSPSYQPLSPRFLGALDKQLANHSKQAICFYGSSDSNPSSGPSSPRSATGSDDYWQPDTPSVTQSEPCLRTPGDREEDDVQIKIEEDEEEGLRLLYTSD